MIFSGGGEVRQVRRASVTYEVIRKGSIMNRKRMLGFFTLGALGLGLAFPDGTWMKLASLHAKEPRKLGKESSSKQGKVESILKNDHGDVDGLMLENGTWVHFPPHMGDRISSIVKIGDSIHVEGRSETTPKGENVFEISELVNGKETVRIAPPHPPRGPKPPHDERPMSAAGKVTEFARAPHGEIDGLVLEDGTIVKFPPHQDQELKELVSIGDKVEIEGRRHTTPEGDIHLHADKIEAHGKMIERDEPGPGPGGPRGPKHGPAHHDEAGPSNAEIMRELKAIRKLLEERNDS